MALCAYKSPIKRLHGKSGDLVFTTLQDDQGISRKFVVPSNPQSAKQIAIRNYNQQVANAYSALTPTQVASWDTAASGLTRTRENTGTTYTLTGHQLFMSVNIHRLCAGLSVSTTAPTSFDGPDRPTFTAVEFNSLTDTLKLTFSSITNDAGFWRVRITLPNPSTAARAQKTGLRMPTASFSACYIDVSTVKTQGYFSLALPADWAAAFEGSIHYFGVEIVPLSESYAPAGADLFVNQQSYTVFDGN